MSEPITVTLTGISAAALGFAGSKVLDFIVNRRNGRGSNRDADECPVHKELVKSMDAVAAKLDKYAEAMFQKINDHDQRITRNETILGMTSAIPATKAKVIMKEGGE